MNDSVITESDASTHTYTPRRITVTAIGDEEIETINARCRHAEAAGIIDNFNQYRDWSLGHTVFEINYLLTRKRESQ